MFSSLIEKSKDSFVVRSVIVFILMIVLFMLVAVKLFGLQVVTEKKSPEADMQELDRISKAGKDESEAGYKYVTEYVLPARGNIYDKNGNLLAYNVQDYNLYLINSASLKNNEERNAAMLGLSKLLKQYGYEPDFTFPLVVDESGRLSYTVSDNALYRFLKNCFGLPSANDLTAEQKETTPDELYDYLKKGNKITSMFGIDDKYTRDEALEIMKYRYQLYTNNPSYAKIKLVSGISEEFRIVLLENLSNIPCVEIEKTYKRVYNDSLYFAHVIGYIGTINEAELAASKKVGLDIYTSESKVGKLGVEQSYDDYLQGSLGEVRVTLNSSGQIVEKTRISEPVDGNDLYLTIERESQIAGYYLVEKNVAAILLSKLVNSMSYGSMGTSADEITIPVYEVYSALIENNVIKVSDFNERELSDAEKNIYEPFSSEKGSWTLKLKELLKQDNTVKYNDCDENTKELLDYLYSALRNGWAVVNKNIDTDSEHFKKYLKGEASISEFLNACIENGNIDTSVLKLSDGYYSTDELYKILYEFIAEKLKTDNGFEKKIYRLMIMGGKISPKDLCLALYDQGVLREDKESYNALANYRLSTFEFIKRKINNLEITPAMLALRPCSGSMVVTDPFNGKVKALCSYPSYDNNRLTNSIDYDYYTELSEDKSYPMLCRATQSKTSTGSTFKPLTAIAALTEGTITAGTTIHDDVKFEKITPSPSCWSTRSHGYINVSEAIMYSCNYFFFETAYRFSTRGGNYSDERGLSVIHKYAEKFGFNSLSGVEIQESMPEISNTDAIRTSIGYYHSFAPVHMAKYVSTIANSGTCYNLTLIDQVKSKEGVVVYEKEPSVYYKLDEVAKNSWDAVHIGMRKVVITSLPSVFKGFNISVAGKTGTQQVSLKQPNNALFISYAPYENPEIAVAVVLPNGYTSSNAAKVAKEYYDFYFNGNNKENLLSGKVYAGEADGTKVGD